jgi:hypothetical protein
VVVFDDPPFRAIRDRISDMTTPGICTVHNAMHGAYDIGGHAFHT